MLKRVLIFIITLILFSSSVFADPNADGFEALNDGDYRSAIKHFELAAEQGDSNGHLYIGIMYAQGEGVLHDYTSAIKYYKLAAEQGNVTAQIYLGAIYSKDDEQFQNYKIAKKYFALAAEQGSAVAQLLLGLEQGNANAQIYLGTMYAKGEGMLPDYKSAIKYYILAAEQGDAYAMLLLGVIYENGDGVVQDYNLAHMWFSLSFILEDEIGASNRDRVAEKMNSSQIENAKKLAKQCLAVNYKNCM